MAAERDYQLYLRRAAQVEAIASGIAYEPHRQAMLRIAKQWETLAAQAANRAGVDLSRS